jgi:hypothetical protein
MFQDVVGVLYHFVESESKSVFALELDRKIAENEKTAI